MIQSACAHAHRSITASTSSPLRSFPAGRLKLMFKLAQFVRNVAGMQSLEATDLHAASLEPASPRKAPPYRESIFKPCMKVRCQFRASCNIGVLR